MSLASMTSEQQAVINSADPRLTVRASAGSGKTRVLVARYLDLLERLPATPDEILTITFTKKAAQEMKHRIVSDLEATGRRQAAQMAESGPIDTIHAFCQRLLSENAVAAGLDPAFEVLDEAESSLYFEEALRRQLLRRSFDHPLVERVVAQLAGTQRYKGSGALHDRIGGDVRTILGTLRGTGIRPDEMRGIYSSAEAYGRVVLSEALAAWPEELRDEVLCHPGGHAVGLSDVILQKKIAKPKWLRLPLVEAEGVEAAEFVCGLALLAADVWQSWEAQMMRLQRFDFNLLESLAVRLMRDNEEVASRLRRQYRAVLVDEAQDVNPVQYRLLDALRLDTEMMVGDPQQSIYGWRQADYRLFQERTRELPCLQLSRNFRSEAGILRFVDALFQDYWGTNYQPMGPALEATPNESDPFALATDEEFHGVEIWPMTRRSPEAIADGIAQLVAEGHALRDIAVLVRTSRRGGEIKRALTARRITCRFEGNTEVFFAGLAVRDVANALTAVADPYRDFSLLAFLHSPFVGLSTDAMALLATQRPVADALDTVEFTDDPDRDALARFRTWFEPLRQIADRLSAWEVMAEIFVRSPYWENLARLPHARQNLANVRKLFRLAARERHLGPFEYAEQMRRIRQMAHKEGEPPAVDSDVDEVRILTIHKAKGLEFPVLVVPDTLDKPRGQDSLVIDGASGLIATTVNRKQNAYRQFVAERDKERTQEERTRVLYVALTRAKQKLCVVADTRAQPATDAHQIARILGFKGEPIRGLRVRRLLGAVAASAAPQES